jgi:hypothetical protein
VWMRDDDGRVRDTLQGAGVQEVRCFPGLPGSDWDRPAWCYYLDQLGLPDTGPPRLAIPAGGDTIAPTRGSESQEPHANEIILHPGSGGRQKCWSIDNFARIEDSIVRGALEPAPGRVGPPTVRWCVGPAESALSLPPGAELLPPLSLVELARRLAGARAYLGNDSGITHIAAAVGCPTTAVFGATDPVVWGPQGRHVRVVGGKEGWPEVDAVLDALRTVCRRGALA